MTQTIALALAILAGEGEGNGLGHADNMLLSARPKLSPLPLLVARAKERLREGMGEEGVGQRQRFGSCRQHVVVGKTQTVALTMLGGGGVGALWGGQGGGGGRARCVYPLVT